MFQSELKTLAQRVKEVTDENTRLLLSWCVLLGCVQCSHRLHAQVRKHVETQLQSEGQEGGSNNAILCQRIDALSQVSNHDTVSLYIEKT